MKHLTFFALVVLLFSGIFACADSNQHPSLAEKTPTLAEDTPVVPLMNPAKADTAKRKWEALRRVLVNTLTGLDIPKDTNFVAKGFHVPYNDIKRILDNIGDTSQLFAMLAIQDSAGIPGKPMISLIFQAPDKTKAQTILYYDFTKPCPSDCPNVSFHPNDPK
jgi:hypothetical protein